MRRFLLLSICATAAIATFACDERMSVAAESPSTGDQITDERGAAGEVSASDSSENTTDNTTTPDAETPPKNPERHDVYPRSSESNSPAGSSSDDEGTDLTGVVNLNEASVETLQKLPGIGPVTAGKIDDYRTKRRFEEPDDIKRIDGIGDVTYRKLQPHLDVEGDTTLASNGSGK